MITKQQALEFIDELSKNHKIFMNLEHGKFYVNTYITIDEDILGDYGFDKGGYIPLELAVWLFIKENINTDLVKEFTKIPVDVDMLEVGQTYRVIYSNYWGEFEEFTSMLSDIDYDRHTNYKLFEFSNGSIKNQGHIEEIYKVNE